MKTLEELKELRENIDTQILIQEKEQKLNCLRIDIAELENDVKMLKEGKKLNEEELDLSKFAWGEFDYS